MALKIGQVAARAGVSVRTLHYYEEIGLLVPADRTLSGHRLYGRCELERLQQIRSLQQLGLDLAEVGAWLERGGVSPRQLVADQLARLQAQREAIEALEGQLARVARFLASDSDRDDDAAVELFLRTLEMMKMLEKHLTPEQLEALQARHDEAAGGDMETARKAWDEALGKLEAHRQAGTDPTDAGVKALAEQWHELSRPFLGEDESVHEALMKAMHEDPKALEDHGLSPDLLAYLGKVMAPDEHP